jgi:hypothetical protein
MRKIRIAAALVALVPFTYCLPVRADWARCAPEGQSCQMSNNGHNLIRYGGDGKYAYMETEGMDHLGCGNDVFGDPDRGGDKFCDYAPVAEELNWVNCATEDNRCALPDGNPRYVRYGTPNGGWVLKIASYGIQCSNDEFPDVASGAQKSCQYSTQPYGGAQVVNSPLQFKGCSSEYSDCHVNSPDGSVVLLRFGKSPNWEYRQASLDTFPCGRETFNVDPAVGQGKFCEYATMPAQITEVTGYWQQVGTCLGCPLTVSVQFGVSGTHSSSKTHSWTNEVSTEISQKFDFFAEKTNVKVAYKHSDTVAEAVSDALTTSETTTKSATCPNTSQTTQVQMFQWKMNVDETCIARGMCRSTIDSFNIVCGFNQPSGYAPVCPPTMCANSTCTVCLPHK